MSSAAWIGGYMAKSSAVIPEITKKKREHRKIFMKMLEKAAHRYGRHKVWSDLIYMSAAAMSQPMDFRQNREDEYLRIIKSYDKETQDMFPQMFGEMTLMFEEEGFGDILGGIYTSLGLADQGKGQVFTPYHICRFMAAVQGDAESLTAEIDRKGYITVGDPCVGAGAMLIAFADYCTEQGIAYQQSVLFAAQDIDPAAAFICYVQMSMFGLSGYVVIGNSLIPSNDYDIWYTAAYFLNGFWHRTQENAGITEETAVSDTAVSAVSEMPAEETALPEKAVLPNMDVVLRETESGQLEFDF